MKHRSPSPLTAANCAERMALWGIPVNLMIRENPHDITVITF